MIDLILTAFRLLFTKWYQKALKKAMWVMDCDGCDPGIPQSHVQQRELLTH